MGELSGVQRGRARRHLAFDLGALALVGVLLIAALGAGAVSLYREFYSPTAFVMRYLDYLETGRAADALALPGVEVDAATLEAAGLPGAASNTLLRSATLSPLTHVKAVSEVNDGDESIVTVSYQAGGHAGTTSFRVASNGMLGIAPVWRFAQSPLTAVNLTVLGSMSFDINSFNLDKRQVSPDGADADPVAPVSLLVFSPGFYSVSVDTAISTTTGVAVLADAPMVNVPVQVQAQPTEEFETVVQDRVDEFLQACTEQQVLQPTGCPFGFVVRNRVDELPTWTISELPDVAIEPDGASWRIPDASATAHISLKVRSIYDGTLYTVEEDVPFVVNGTITALADGSVSIKLGGSEG